MPILMLAIIFGLSMDYEVFLLSRIRERYDQTGDNAASVAAGLQRTGGVITSLALLLIIVVGAFSASGITFIKLIGVGMIVALLVDATIIRVLLVPATMRLLGQANWWAPRPLRRLYARYGITGGGRAGRAGARGGRRRRRLTRRTFPTLNGRTSRGFPAIAAPASRPGRRRPLATACPGLCTAGTVASRPATGGRVASPLEETEMNQPVAVPEVLSADLPAGVFLLDVREDDEWAAGHAPEAVHVRLGDLGARAGELPQ